MKKILPASLEVMLAPLALILVLIVLTIFAFNFGFSKISEQRDTLSTAEKNEAVLKSKQDLLNQVGSSILSSADISLISVPDENPAFVVLAQLKNLAVAKTVTIGNIKIGSPVSDEGNVSRIEINFDVDGGVGQALDFVNSISGFSPLTSVQKVKMSQSGGAARLSVNVQAYWAGLPKTLPKITDPVHELSGEDSQLLVKLGSLTPPPFSKITPSGPSGRSDPFSF